ncbi:hypothetical protein Q9K02_06720 [Qipengyuania sp. G39]|uniref:DUF11 domain-containing protein n=1 Tax=Qipengyuania profundimaris TaxID=3067652 RepID=A0ABT9HNY7_9SPHN|nr:hypothetical protein [Qipengyuania sp. G39]MDP4574831.1 hypothetical protein [Qipengyuania sp. G39]
MKNHRHQLAASTLALATLLAASPALADGVPAGSIIENTATASYDDGGSTPRTVTSNTVEVQVDELLNVTTTWQDGSAVPVGNGTAVLTFEVTNTGNGPEAFNLTADPGRTGNDFDVTINAIVYDDGDGIYEEGVDIVISPGDPTPLLDPDEAITIFVIVSSPGGLTDGETSDVNLLAEAVTGTGAPGTTFAGQGEGGSDAVVGLTNADADADGSLIARVAQVSLVKSAIVADPFGGTEAVPGAIVTFTIVAEVTGTGSFDNFVITDDFPTFTSYEAGTLTLDGAALTDAADADAGEASATGISVDVGTVTSGNDYTVTFDVVVD